MAEHSAVSRRDALRKGAAAAAVTGVAWSAPRIEGLSLRPDYAAAQTQTCSSFSITMTGTVAENASSRFVSLVGTGTPSPSTPVGILFFSLESSNVVGIQTNSNVIASAFPEGGPACTITFNEIPTGVTMPAVIGPLITSSTTIGFTTNDSFTLGPAGVTIAGDICCD